MAPNGAAPKRIQVSLRKDVAANLEALVPRGERNRFMIEAIEKIKK